MARVSNSSTTLNLDGDGLTLNDAEWILHGNTERLGLAPAARKHIEESRRCLEELIATGATIYGVNTGFGKLANRKHPPQSRSWHYKKTCSAATPSASARFSIPAISRLTLALRIQALAKGFSGVTPALLERPHRVVQSRRRAGDSRSRGASGPAATWLPWHTWPWS